jgi:ribosomal protein S10
MNKNSDMFVKVKLKSLNSKLLNNYINILLKTKRIEKYLRLPTKKRRITILASPHVNIKAREHYQITIFSALLLIKKENLLLPPAGIGYRLKISKTL